MRLFALLIGLAFAVSPLATQAQTGTKTVIIDAGARWVLDTEAVGSAKTIEKGDWLLFGVAIFPEHLIRIEQPVIDVGTAGVKISSGKQFVKYDLINGREVYCSTKTLDYLKDGGSIFYMRRSGTYACLVDTNGDGKLDGVYEINSRLQSGTPIITHGKDSGYEAIEPVSFTEIDPRLFDNHMGLYLRWSSGNGLDDAAKFEAMLKAKEGTQLTFYHREGLEKGQVPGTFNYLNMAFSLSSPKSKILDVKITKLGRGARMVTSGEQVRFEIVE